MGRNYSNSSLSFTFNYRKVSPQRLKRLFADDISLFSAITITFDDRLSSVPGKFNKTTELFSMSRNTLTSLALITIYKAFVRSHLNYDDIHYNHAYIISRKTRKIEMQYLSSYNRGDLWHFKRKTLPRIRLRVSR